MANLVLNGSFEAGDFSNWDIHHGTSVVKSGKLSIDYTEVQSSQPAPLVVGPVFAFPQTNVTVASPSGAKMALLNDLVGGQHATCIHQTIVLPGNFVGDCAYLSYFYAVFFVGSDHSKDERPRLTIDINYKKDGNWKNLTQSDVIATETQSDGWVDVSLLGANDAIWFRQDTATIGLAGLLAGDTVRVRFVIADCPHGAHGAACLIDNLVLENACDTPHPPISYENPLPNVFTPNGDGVNDVWGIRQIQNACSVEVEIFDRWGDRIVYSKHSRGTGYWPPLLEVWNGKIRTKRRKVGSGKRKRYYTRKVMAKDTNNGVVYYVAKLKNCESEVSVNGFFHIFF